MQPELTIKSQQIDLDLCAALGDKPSDFLVLCFDGVQLEDFGTPYDTEANRARWRMLINSLNDKSDESRWPERKNTARPLCADYPRAYSGWGTSQAEPLPPDIDRSRH